MPHSSGGGSSSSGGHSDSSSSSYSSSFSSSSSSSDSDSRGGMEVETSGVAYTTYYYKGARCFVHYQGNKPTYLYSNDDLRKAKLGKQYVFPRALICFVISFHILKETNLRYEGLNLIAIFFMVFGIVFLIAGMAADFDAKDLTELRINKADPKTVNCPHCGNKIVSNLHEDCPYCGGELELNPFVEDEMEKQRVNLMARDSVETNNDNVNLTAEAISQQNLSIVSDSLKSGADGNVKSASDSDDVNETQTRQSNLSYESFLDDRDYKKYVPGLKRYVYYNHKQPIYFFSKLELETLENRYNRPKWWLLFVLPFISLLFCTENKCIVFVEIAVICLAAYLIMSRSVIGGERISKLTEVDNPENEPDIAICPYCGGYFVNGIHQSCPHCNKGIERNVQLKVLSAEEYKKVPLPPQKHAPFIRNRTLKNCYFKGATCYAYYKNKQPYYVYSNIDLTHEDTNPWLSYRIAKQVVALILIFVVLLNIGNVYNTVTQPLKPNQTYEVLLCDNADVLSDNQESALLQTLKEFQKVTGVPVAFYTEYNSTWRFGHSNMIDYAYDLYIKNFDDEIHWVVIYSQPEYNDADRPDWYWEGMQGDYTVKVLDVFLNDFNNQTQSQLAAGESVFNAFNDSFTAATDTFASQEPIFNPEKVKQLFTAAGFSLLFALWSLITPGYHFKKLVVAGKTENPETEYCPHCGNVIVSNVHKKCPHCQCELE